VGEGEYASRGNLSVYAANLRERAFGGVFGRFAIVKFEIE
jgi:hypothetical protein